LRQFGLRAPMIAAARTSAPVEPPGRLFVFGMGYTARTLAGQLRAGGWRGLHCHA
jgi:hypothetical protein